MVCNYITFAYFLQIAHQNSLAVDVDLALVYASHYCKFETMACLVDEGHATSFLCPLVKASERGCLQVVQWFVNRHVSDIEMCLAVTTAASCGHFAVATHLLAHIPGMSSKPSAHRFSKLRGDRVVGLLKVFPSFSVQTSSTMPPLRMQLQTALRPRVRWIFPKTWLIF